MRVLPKKGLKVFNPATKLHLSKDKPINVPESNYWRRRLADGDISIVAKEEIKKKVKKSKETKHNGGN